MVNSPDNTPPVPEGIPQHVSWGPWLRYEQGSLLPSFDIGVGVEANKQPELRTEIPKANDAYAKARGSILTGNNSTREKMKRQFGRYFRGLMEK